MKIIAVVIFTLFTLQNARAQAADSSSVCELAGAFVYRDAVYQGSFDAADRAPLGLREDPCIAAAYASEQRDSLFTEVFTFVHDDAKPIRVFFDNNGDTLTKCFVFVCKSEGGSVPARGACFDGQRCRASCEPLRETEIQPNFCDKFYYIVLTGRRGGAFTDLKISPPGDCPTDPETLACGSKDADAVGATSKFSTASTYAACYNNNRTYAGGEKIYKIALDKPAQITLTLEAAEEMGMFLFSFLCGQNCLAFAENLPALDRKAVFSKILSEGTYYVFVDKNAPGGNPAFSLSMQCVPVSPFGGGPDCLVSANARHDLRIRASAFDFDFEDQIHYLFTDFSGKLTSTARLARYWDTGQQDMFWGIAGDEAGDSEKCSFAEGEPFTIFLLRTTQQGRRTYRRLTATYDLGAAGATGGGNFSEGKFSVIENLKEDSLVVFGLETSTLQPGKDSAVIYLKFHASKPWKVRETPPASWLWVSPEEASGSSGVEIRVSPNPGGKPRRTTLHFFTEENEALYFHDVAVEQLGLCQTPAVAIEASSARVCAEDPVQLRAALGGLSEENFRFRWNTGDTSAVILADPAAAQTTYSVTVTHRSCAAGGTAARVVEVAAAPPLPVFLNEKIEYCAAATPPPLTVSVPPGQTADWFDQPLGGNLLAAGTTVFTPSGPGIFYVETRDLTAGCASTARRAVELVENPTPPPPVAVNDTAVCAGAALPVLSAVAAPGLTVDWYDAPIGGSLLASGQKQFLPDRPGIFYAETRDPATGCVSEGPRAAVALVVQKFAVSGLVSCDPDFLTYSFSVETDPPATGLSSSAGVVTDAGGGFFSIKNIPAGVPVVLRADGLAACADTLPVTPPLCQCPPLPPPDAVASAIFCNGVKSELTAAVGPGETADWFDAPTGGAPLPGGVGVTTFEPPGLGIFYARRRDLLNHCASDERTSVVVFAGQGPSLALGLADCPAGQQPVLISATTSSFGVTLSAVGGSVSSQGGGFFSIAALPGAALAVTATDADGCQTTAFLDVPAAVAAPAGTAAVAVCAGEALPALSASSEPGQTVNWFDAPAGGNLLAADSYFFTPPVPGTFYAEARDPQTGCASAGRKAISLTVSALPQVFIFEKTCSPDLKTYSVRLKTGAPTVVLRSDEGEIEALTDSFFILKNLPAGKNATLLATDTTTGCQLEWPLEAPDCSCPFVAPPVSLGDAALCFGQSFPVLSVSVGPGVSVDWFRVNVGGQALKINSTTFAPSAGGLYFVQARDSVSGCASATRTPIRLTVRPLPRVSVDEKICHPAQKKYAVRLFTDGDSLVLKNTAGELSDEGNGFFLLDSIQVGLPLLLEVTATATGCRNTLLIESPVCDCFVAPPLGGGSFTFCPGDAPPTFAANHDLSGFTTDWYDQASGGMLLASGMDEFTPPGAGSFYAEAREEATDCVSFSRTLFRLSASPVPTVYLGPDRVLCPDKTLTISAQGVFQKIEWSTGATSPSITVTAPGTYAATVTNAQNCTATDAVEVEEDPPMSVVIAQTGVIECFGDATGALTASVAGGSTPYKYAWSNGATGATVSGLLAGLYELVVISAAGCSAEASVLLDQPTALVLVDTFIIPATEDSPTGAIIVLVEGGEPGYTFDCFFQGQLYASDPAGEFFDLQWGFYAIVVTDRNGCKLELKDIYVPMIIATDEAAAAAGVRIFPNPTGGKATLRFELPAVRPVEIRVFDALGRRLFDLAPRRLQQAEVALDLAALPAGWYRVEVRLEGKRVWLKILKF